MILINLSPAFWVDFSCIPYIYIYTYAYHLSHIYIYIVVWGHGGRFEGIILTHHIITSYFTIINPFHVFISRIIHHLHFMYSSHASSIISISCIHLIPIHLIILQLHFSSQHFSHQKNFSSHHFSVSSHHPSNIPPCPLIENRLVKNIVSIN